jgi:hypothetical protein
MSHPMSIIKKMILSSKNKVLKKAIFCLLMASTVFLMSFKILNADLKELPKKWINLFNGKNLEGWHQFNRIGDAKNWKVEDGVLVCLGFKGPSGAGDLVTDQSFENFELIWDWKLDKESNSGIFYHVVEGNKYKRPSETAPEYQLIDELNFTAKLEDWQKTGANYAMYAPSLDKTVKPIGEWNSSKIIFNNGHVEHWLNGQLIVKFKAWSRDWENKKSAEKWKAFPDYGISKKGSIGLQDHKSKAYFKNIKIREL